MTARRVLAVVGWTLVVVFCSTGVWAVIRTAGTGVTAAREIPDATTSLPPSASPTPTRSPRPHPHPHAHRSASGGTSTAPTPAAPTATPRPDDPATSQAQQPAEVRRTWQGGAGAVVASCRGSAITFRGAQANSGWRVEVGSRGPEEVEVQFTGGGDDGEGEVHVRARCSGGEPRFSTGDD